MRVPSIAAVLALPFLVIGGSGCGAGGMLGMGGHDGPTLPADVGANHGAHRAAPTEEAPPEEPPEPVAVGTQVWGNFHDTGFYFHGVVVERRGEMHRVLYTDGASEWLPAAGLLPDSLREGASIHVRPTFGAEFQTATVVSRLGEAVYVRLANGDQRWTTLSHIRFQEGQEHVPARGDEPAQPEASESGDVGSVVMVNYELQGLRFPATVTALGGDRRAFVVYFDGESGVAINGTFIGDDITEGSVVHVRRSWEPPDWVRGHVQTRLGNALQVLLDDGGVTWTSMVRVREPVEPQSETSDDDPGETEASPSDAGEADAPADAPARSRRRHR